MKTQLNDLFDQMDEEKGNKIDDKIQVEDDVNYEEIIDKIIEVEHEQNKQVARDNYYDQTTDLFQYSKKFFPYVLNSKQINNFSNLLKSIHDERYANVTFGFYIDLLMDNSKDTEFEFNISKKLIPKLPGLGYYNNGNTIKINVDNFDHDFNKKNNSSDRDLAIHTGLNMKKGKLILSGTYHSIGCDMKGGEIILNGDVLGSTGVGMTGGTIIVNGEIKSILGFIYGGNIYHKDKQIVKDGKMLDKTYIRK